MGCADEVNGKAGNLNHALRQIYARGAPVAPGEVVAVFDCDQARRLLLLEVASKRWAPQGGTMLCDCVRTGHGLDFIKPMPAPCPMCNSNGIDALTCADQEAL